jgi:hypothetical protein
MSNVVNLNKFRKRKAKLDKAKRADVNRRLHGRTKAERAQDELQKRQLTRKVDGARLEGDTSGSTDDAEPGPPSSHVE